jgi:hypothetical protein
MEPNYESLDPEEGTNKVLAILSVIVGAVSLVAGLIPICGAAFSIAGIILGVLGRKSDNRRIANIGLGLSAFALTLAIVYGAMLVIRRSTSG